MNKLIIRFIILRHLNEIEVTLDSRLSFKDNLELLKNISDLFSINNFYIMKEDEPVLLNTNTPICEFQMADFTRLYLL